MHFWLAVDIAGAGMLLTAGCLSLSAWWRSSARSGGSLYWLFAGMGLVFLAADERLSLHERLGRRLWEAGVPTPPGVNHMDDAVLGGFAVAGLAITLVFLPELLRHRAVLAPLAAGGVLTAAAVSIDARAPVDGMAPKIEELLELAGIVLFLAAMWLRWSGGRLPARVAVRPRSEVLPAEPD